MHDNRPIPLPRPRPSDALILARLHADAARLTLSLAAGERRYGRALMAFLSAAGADGLRRALDPAVGVVGGPPDDGGE